MKGKSHYVCSICYTDIACTGNCWVIDKKNLLPPDTVQPVSYKCYQFSFSSSTHFIIAPKTGSKIVKMIWSCSCWFTAGGEDLADAQTFILSNIEDERHNIITKEWRRVQPCSKMEAAVHSKVPAAGVYVLLDLKKKKKKTFFIFLPENNQIRMLLMPSSL